MQLLCAVHHISDVDEEDVVWFKLEWTAMSGIILPREKKRKPTLT